MRHCLYVFPSNLIKFQPSSQRYWNQTTQGTTLHSLSREFPNSAKTSRLEFHGRNTSGKLSNRTGSGRSCIKNSNTIQHCIRTVLLMNITFKQNMTTVSSRIRAWLCGAPQVRLTFAGIHPWAHWMFIRILVRTNPVGRALLYRGRSPNWRY